MKVSVIIPVYNTALYLRACLDSVIAQEVEEKEIICVNDGSSDGCMDILEEYQDRYPTIFKIINRGNGGLSAARNSGIDIAVGNYLAFVDSDDRILPGMLKDMLSLAERSEADMVICDLDKVDAEGNLIKKMPQLRGYQQEFDIKDFPEVFGEMGFFACNKLFKKELFAGRRFREGVHFEDIELIPELLLNCQKLGYINFAYYHYFERQGSISKTHTIKGIDLLRAVEKNVEIFKTSKLSEYSSVLKDFIILQGFYSFGAYLAFVKDKKAFEIMQAEMWNLMRNNGISKKEILSLKRHGKNYLRSLPLKKQIFYMALLSGSGKLIQPLISR